MFSAVQKKATILVVDGCSLISTSVSLVLKKLGYDVMTADNGDSALELLKSHKIHVLLLDICISSSNSRFGPYTLNSLVFKI